MSRTDSSSPAIPTPPCGQDFNRKLSCAPSSWKPRVCATRLDSGVRARHCGIRADARACSTAAAAAARARPRPRWSGAVRTEMWAVWFGQCWYPAAETIDPAERTVNAGEVISSMPLSSLSDSVDDAESSSSAGCRAGNCSIVLASGGTGWKSSSSVYASAAGPRTSATSKTVPSRSVTTNSGIDMRAPAVGSSLPQRDRVR